MLYTDSNLLTAADLAALDPELPEVAAAEGLDVEVSIAEAWQTCGDELLTRMDAFGGGEMLSADPATWSLAWGGSLGSARSRVFLTQVVASDAYAAKLSPLQRWLRAHALATFYRAAGRRVTNDRYTAKHEDFLGEAKLAWLRLAVAGLPVCTAPLPCPGALHERGAAGAVAFSAVAGGAAASPVSYDVAVTYMTADNIESGPSALQTLTVPASQVIRADITTLAWPTAARDFSLRVPAGWLIYAGAAGSGVLHRQTLAALPIATKTYTFSAAPVLSGILLGPGQLADYRLAFHSTLQRA